MRPAPAARPRASVTAVVLNYRAPEQTSLAVRSLQSSFTPPSTIVVVDNSPDDGPSSMSSLLHRTARQGVTLIDAPRNLGFAGGVNVGIGAAIGLSSEFVLLVNSDAVLAPDAIAHLLEAAAACPASRCARAADCLARGAGLDRVGWYRLLDDDRSHAEPAHQPSGA